MQIMIDIDDNLYTRLFDNGDEYVADMRRACVAIRKGIVLPSPCDVCRFRPPSSADGKPCCMCPAEKGVNSDANSD